MKKMIMVITMLVGMTAFGHNGWNHWVAGNILGGLAFGLGAGLTAPRTTTVVTAPVVATPVVQTVPVITTIPTAPVATTIVPTIPTYSYGYYNNVYCPMYDGYYYYNNAWVWGGIGYRRPIPTFVPRPFHGIPPPIHRPAPMPLRPAPRPMAPGRPGGGPRPPMSPHHFR